VSFAPGWGARAQVTFDELVDWTKRREPDIRHFSGHATYRKTILVPDTLLAANSSVVLDLGEVYDLATVRVNGHEIATLWNAPWRVDVTSAVRPGPNALEIVVVNAWHNRLAGDAARPESARHSFVSTSSVQANSALLPAGLIGPVTLRTLKSVECR